MDQLTMNDEVIAEIRELRSDFRTFSLDVVERVAKLEADNHSVMGNSQPGRLAEVETAVTKLQTWRKYVIGYVSGCTVILMAIGGFFAWLLKG